MFKKLFKEETQLGLAFTVPLVFDMNYLKFIGKLNAGKYRYKIKRVYGSLPISAYGKSGFEHGRSIPFDKNGIGIKIRTLGDMKEYVSEVHKMGLDFVYLMNNVSTISNFDFQFMAPKIDQFLSELEEIGIKYVTVGNQLLGDFIKNTHPNINVGASTMMDITSLTKAESLVKRIGLKYIIPTTDLNKNFIFIDNIIKTLPNTELELMADEGCIFGCPTKNLHYSLFGVSEKTGLCSGMFKEFPIAVCDEITRCDPELQIIKNKIIYPWEIPTYDAHGVKLIKLVGRDHELGLLKSKIEYYVRGAEDRDYALDAFYSVYNSRFIMRKDFIYGKYKMKDLIEFIPDINYFVNSKTDCRIMCGVQCKKCYESSEMLRKKFTVNNDVNLNIHVG